MAHPFFDVPKFPLSRPEAVRLHKTLTDAIYNPHQIDIIYKQCSGNLPPLSLSPPPDVIWKEALQNLTASGVLRVLCDLMLQRFQNNDYIKNVLRDVINAQAATDVRIISDDVLVLDRVGLRQQLERLEPGTKPMKVLLVRGGPRSGKSHGRYLFERAAVDQGAQPVYVSTGIVATVEDVVLQLFSVLGASDKIPPRDTSDDAWYRVVCFKLLEVASNPERGRQLWIAVDDLGPAPDGGPLLDTQIRKFFEQFALNMMDPAFRKWFRLMLIHYPDGPVQTRWKRDIWSEDRTSDADVQQGDVADLLRLWAVTHNRQVIEGELTALAADVVAKAEAPAVPGQDVAPRLQRIHDTLIETLRDLERRSP